jgi:hypothetical protein
MTVGGSFKSLYGTMKTLFVCTLLMILLVVVFFKYLRLSHITRLTEWTGRPLSTRTKSEEAILPPGWKKGAYVNNV